MEDSKILELLFARSEDGIKHMDDFQNRICGISGSRTD